MKKYLGFILLIGLVVFGWQGVLAKQEDLPEKEGIYNVPGKPNLKLRVFVYKEKPEVQKGKPVPSPVPVCGLSDNNSLMVDNSAGWHLPQNFVYTLNSSTAPSSVQSNISQITELSFSEWTKALSGQVSISKNPVETTVSRAGFDGQNIVAWGRTSGSALGVTYIWYDNTGLAVEVDTIMNKKFSWSWTPYDPSNLCSIANTYDARNILTHEIGHWFGLDDHYTSGYQENTMYGYGSKNEVKKDTLTTGDVNGLNLIY